VGLEKHGSELLLRNESKRMVSIEETSLADRAEPQAVARSAASCFHCGEPCPGPAFAKLDKTFCCQGCLTVHDLLTGTGLGHFYDLARHPGVRMRKKSADWAYLDQPELARHLLDFKDDNLTRVTFHIPAIHCLACVWLLENLFQLHPAIGRCQVDFSKRQAAITFATGELRLGELVALLAGIGYEPQLTLGELDQALDQKPARKRQALQIGLAGFAFGNIMLFSLPMYLGLDSLSGPAFKTLFGWLGLGLALPAVLYSASDYWRSALFAVRQRVVTLDVPIALGLAAIYGQSFYEISTETGAGYCDSLTGLILFLLCGRLFQRVTYDRLAFDRDYKSFFPLSVVRKTGAKEETISISNVAVGDRLVLRNGELIPADARLLSGSALLDYSFVTGECEAVLKRAGDYLYAGGQQVGGGIEVETVKPVSQSYLTSLWNDPAFKKQREDQLETLTNRYSRRFTRIVIGVAAGAAVFWLASGNPARALKAFTSVLIVACPCALALAAPFALGTAQRLLARLQVFLKNTLILERMAKVDAIVFDKTGTLTARANELRFCGATALSPEEERLVCSLARHSTHPHSLRIAESLGANRVPEPVTAFVETPGCGVEGCVDGHHVRLGSRAWLQAGGTAVPGMFLPAGSASFLAIDGVCRGAFGLKMAFRPEIRQLLGKLRDGCDIALLSGDNEKERELFQNLFGPGARLLFNQSPLDKLQFIHALQHSGKTVMMVGDGLNDAGALKQSDVGVAVVETIGAFSPASDVILEAGQVARVADVLTFARRASRIVRLSFGVSALYNAVGIAIAAAGLLSPLVCAFLMPISSVSVVLFACGTTRWAARRGGLGKP
jgi:Cu+-exporting ATPase